MEYGLIHQTEINITDTVNIEILLKQISEKNIEILNLAMKRMK